MRNCNNCGNEYNPDTRNLKRGWGLCCSKSCAASLRERSKPKYSPERVQRNNYRREHWNEPKRTVERYKIIDNVAIDENDQPVYNL